MNISSTIAERKILREMNQLNNSSSSNPSSTIKTACSSTCGEVQIASEKNLPELDEKEVAVSLLNNDKTVVKEMPDVSETLSEVDVTTESLYDVTFDSSSLSFLASQLKHCNINDLKETKADASNTTKNVVSNELSTGASEYTTIEDHDKPENIPLPEDIIFNELSTNIKSDLECPEELNPKDKILQSEVSFNLYDNLNANKIQLEKMALPYSESAIKEEIMISKVSDRIEQVHNTSRMEENSIEYRVNEIVVSNDQTFDNSINMDKAGCMDYENLKTVGSMSIKPLTNDLEIVETESNLKKKIEASEISEPKLLIQLENNLTNLEEKKEHNSEGTAMINKAIPMEIDVSLTHDISLNNTVESPKIIDNNDDHNLNKPIMNSSTKNNKIKSKALYGESECFKTSETFHFSDTDFEYLGSLNSDEADVNRNSLLLKFDPLLKKPVSTSTKLEVTTEETFENIRDSFTNSNKEATIAAVNAIEDVSRVQKLDDDKHMSSIIISAMKDLEDKLNSETIMSEQNSELKMAELGKKAKNDLLKSEELEKKLEEELKKRIELEQREEQLLKRIADKDRAFTKLQNVVAEYEKAISEMITEKEQLVKNFDSTCNQLKEDSETNAQHLGSLECTFSDLHAKYERTKQVAAELKEREATLGSEKKALEESLRIQEQRYEKMKNHAVAQLENANIQLEEQMKSHQLEITKLRAQLKKEEISRASIQEQLSQKSKENEELVKICDELINGGGSS